MWYFVTGFFYLVFSRVIYAPVLHPFYCQIHLFTHSPVDTYLGCFHFLAIKNKAAMSIHVHISCEHMFLFLLNIYLGLELWCHMGTLFLTFWGIAKQLFLWARLVSKEFSVFAYLEIYHFLLHFLRIVLLDIGFLYDILLFHLKYVILLPSHLVISM